MLDLIVMKRAGSTLTATQLFGENQDPFIPFHCVKSDDIWFEILFTDFVTTEQFTEFEEPEKFSFMESVILYDKNGFYAKELEKLHAVQCEECEQN